MIFWCRRKGSGYFTWGLGQLTSRRSKLLPGDQASGGATSWQCRVLRGLDFPEFQPTFGKKPRVFFCAVTENKFSLKICKDGDVLTCESGFVFVSIIPLIAIFFWGGGARLESVGRFHGVLFSHKNKQSCGITFEDDGRLSFFSSSSLNVVSIKEYFVNNKIAICALPSFLLLVPSPLVVISS